jgi:hypothetical protein
MSPTTELAWFKSSYSGSEGDDCVEVALSWRKSTYCSGSQGDCVEVARNWRKSGYSSGSEGDCVEVAACTDLVHVRDSKDKDGAQLALGADAWTRFLSHAARA